MDNLNSTNTQEELLIIKNTNDILSFKQDIIRQFLFKNIKLNILLIISTFILILSISLLLINIYDLAIIKDLYSKMPEFISSSITNNILLIVISCVLGIFWLFILVDKIFIIKENKKFKNDISIGLMKIPNFVSRKFRKCITFQIIYNWFFLLIFTVTVILLLVLYLFLKLDLFKEEYNIAINSFLIKVWIIFSVAAGIYAFATLWLQITIRKIENLNEEKLTRTSESIIKLKSKVNKICFIVYLIIILSIFIIIFFIRNRKK